MGLDHQKVLYYGQLLFMSVSVACKGTAFAFPAEKGGDGWTFELGLGGELEPQFAGSDKREFEPDPYVNIAYRKGPTIYYSSIVDYGVYHSLDERWIVGASVGLEIGRDEDDAEALTGMGNIDDTWELRFDLAYRFDTELTVAGRAMTAGADKDNVYFLAAIYDVPTPWEYFDLTINSDISWGSAKHLATEFGVSPQQAVDSGYPEYVPDGGLKSIGIGFSGKYRFNEHWFGFAELDYEKYDSAGADSPFVDNDYDYEGEIGIGYRF